MKSVISDKTFTNYIAIIVTITIAGMFGCKSSELDRAESTRTSMQHVDEDMDEVVNYINQIEASFTALTDSVQTREEIEEVFSEYSETVAELEEHANHLSEESEDMNEQGDEYFSEWEQQDGSYTNPDIQRLSRDRRRELRDTYNEVIEANRDVANELERYVADNREIQNFLSNDLSSGGVASISEMIPEVVENGENIKAEINRVQYSIDQALSEMNGHRNTNN